MKKEKNEIIMLGIKLVILDPGIKIESTNNGDFKVTGTFCPKLKIIDDTMINLIKFNKEYYKSIINGLKTQTLRKSNKRFKEAEIVKAIFPGVKEEVYLMITKTGYKQFKYLNDEDARLEGYETVNELKKDLLKIYPSLDALTRLYYYQFKVVDTIAV